MADPILVTGANGFVGTALCRVLQEFGFPVRGAVRDLAKRSPRDQPDGIEWVVLHDRSSEAETRQVLSGIRAIVHLAARVHVIDDPSPDPLQEFRRINCDWTERLARAAIAQGIRRFVCMSSVKVNGERSTAPVTEQDPPNPQDPYGISKWEAEQALAKVKAQTGLEFVVVRAPLVYGPGVRGNFLQLLNVIRHGVPLPLASVRNQRSLIYRENLVNALVRCVGEERAAGQTYLVSDGEDLSTPHLIRRLGKALGLTVHLWPVPQAMLRWIGLVVGKGATIDRLVGSLQVDSAKIRRELNWYPTFSVDHGFAETAAWYRGQLPARRPTS